MRWSYEDDAVVLEGGHRLTLSPGPFRDVRPWKQFAVVGSGGEIWFVELATGQRFGHEAPGTFAHFFEAEECLLAACQRQVLRFDGPDRPSWVSPEVGRDGVVIDAVADGLVLGSGEWEPAGGWVEFALDLATGQPVET